jgi:hypothetical protein
VVRLGNNGDTVGLRCGGITIDVVVFTTWPVPKGRSFSLDPRHYDAADNDLQASWCTGTTVYNTLDSDAGLAIDYGSPGVSNPLCP